MKSKSILYVDSDPDFCFYVKNMIERCDERFRVTLARSAADAIKLLKAKVFDLLLLDYCLDSGTGADVCRISKAQDRSLPVIFYSVLGRDVDRKNAAVAGADTYLSKPEDIGRIVPSIRQLLGIERMEPLPFHGRRPRMPSAIL